MKRLPFAADVTLAAWASDGLSLLALDREHPASEPPLYDLYALSWNGSHTLRMHGRLGYVVGLTANGPTLWRGEGVAPAVYTARPPAPGPGPFRLEAIPVDAAAPVVPATGLLSILATASLGWATTKSR